MFKIRAGGKIGNIEVAGNRFTGGTSITIDTGDLHGQFTGNTGNQQFDVSGDVDAVIDGPATINHTKYGVMTIPAGERWHVITDGGGMKRLP